MEQGNRDSLLQAFLLKRVLRASFLEGDNQVLEPLGRVDVAENLPLRAAVKITRPDMKNQRTHLLDIDALTARCQLFSNRWARACH